MNSPFKVIIELNSLRIILKAPREYLYSRQSLAYSTRTQQVSF